jgi:hypothetical protein
VSALLALVVIGAAGITGLLLVRSAVVALVATSTGHFHQITEYITAIVLSDANWDAPPGSGYLVVVLCLLAAISTVVLWWLDYRTAPPAASPDDPGTRSSAPSGTESGAHTL